MFIAGGLKQEVGVDASGTVNGGLVYNERETTTEMGRLQRYLMGLKNGPTKIIFYNLRPKKYFCLICVNGFNRYREYINRLRSPNGFTSWAEMPKSSIQ